jgi:phosphatidylserine decarboxylase
MWFLATTLAVRLHGRPRAAWAAVAASAAALFGFFRDPERDPARGVVLAPADGRILSVTRASDGRTTISTFMRLFDVHVNRAPADGVVRELIRRPGGFRPAFDKDASSNERVAWRIESSLGEFELVQIAGAAARRIVTYRRVGERIVQGERIGMIRFGSRVDLVMPAAIEPSVRVGDRVRAGVTTLGL